MCIAIVKFKGKSIDEGNLKRGWDANPDGAGFAYVDEHNEIQMFHSMTWEGFIPLYRQAVMHYGDTSDFLIHFRITSRGDTTLANCHPFRVNDDMVLIHNGTITNITIPVSDTRSDTKIFAEEYLRSIGEQFLINGYLWDIIEQFVGYSKVCILHKEKGVYILNEKKGEYGDDGNWYSNSTYKIPVYKSSHSNYYNYDNKYNVADSYRYEATKKKEVVHHTSCDWCFTSYDAKSMTTIEDYRGKLIDICYECFNELREDDSQGLCIMCGESLNTKKYHVEEWGSSCFLCSSCVKSLELDSSQYKILSDDDDDEYEEAKVDYSVTNKVYNMSEEEWEYYTFNLNK